MVQFYPKAVSKSYWKRMDAESQDFPRGACLTFGGPAVSPLRVNDLTTVSVSWARTPFARYSRKGVCEEGAREGREVQSLPFRLCLDGVSASPWLVPISTLVADLASAPDA
jgi:hypothetical protein